MPDRLSRPKRITEKIEGLDWKVATPVRILAVDKLCLLRMQDQPTSRKSGLQGTPQCSCFLFASAVTDDVVRVPFEWNVGIFPHHPHVEGIMQEQIRQNRAHHPTLWSSRCTRLNATILHLYRSFQPAFDVEKPPGTVRMLANRFE